MAEEKVKKKHMNFDDEDKMTHFDKFVMKAVGVLVSTGIAGTITMLVLLNVSIAEIRTELNFVSEKLSEASENRYTSTMAAQDKQFFMQSIRNNKEDIDHLEKEVEAIRRDFLLRK